MEIKNLQNGDTILLTLSKECTLDEAQQLVKNWNILFPNQRVIASTPHLVEKIEILRESKNMFLDE